MADKNYLDPIARAGLVFKKPTFKGGVCWRGYGFKYLDLLFSSAIESFSNRFEVYINREHSIFMPEAFQAFLSEEIKQYENCFKAISLNNQAIRADVICDDIHKLKQIEKDNSVIMSMSDLYRTSSGKLFLYDRVIFPTIGINGFLTGHPWNYMQRMRISIDDLFDKMLLPRIWVTTDMGYQNYGDYLFMPLMPENKTQLTIMSTLFVLNSAFSTFFEVNRPIADIGLSQKLLAIYFHLQTERKHVTLPSKMAPYQVGVLNHLNNEQTILNHLEKMNIRSKNFNVSKNKTQKICRKIAQMGIPVQLYKNHANQLLARNLFANNVRILESVEQLPELLDEIDVQIMTHNQSVFNFCMQHYDIIKLAHINKNDRSKFKIIGRLLDHTESVLVTKKEALGSLKEKADNTKNLNPSWKL